MGKLESELRSFGFLENRASNWSRGHDIIQIVRSKQFQRNAIINAIMITWREEWKDFLAIIFDYSEVDGPICIVPTQVLFNSHFVAEKRNMPSYRNSGNYWFQLFKFEHELPQLILKYENKWDILAAKKKITVDSPVFPQLIAKPTVKTNKIEKELVGKFRGMLKAFNDKHLLGLYCDLMEELRERNIVRSSNNPVSDYGEKTVAELLNLKLSVGSNKGYDAIDEKKGVRYQIKSRRLTKHNGSRQLGVIRNLDQKLFDYLIAVIFNESFEPIDMLQIPIDIIPKYSKFSEHQNGHILILAGDILQEKTVKKLL